MSPHADERFPSALWQGVADSDGHGCTALLRKNATFGILWLLRYSREFDSLHIERQDHHLIVWPRWASQALPWCSCLIELNG